MDYNKFTFNQPGEIAMPAPQIILDLVQRFHDSREQYRSGRYNEAQLRREFLDPFFSALGWDMTNAQNNAPQYREVIQEDTLEIEGQAKAPDYAFGIFGVRKFFVEAKKPAVNIRYDIHPAFQLRRYAWSAHLPLSILTDFEEFAVYDTRVKPDHKDSASVARTMVFTYADYAGRWDEIASIFSKDAILKGSFDRYVQDTKAKKGTTEVDDDFLKSIEGWRELLARNIALRNPSARSESTLNYAVQMTIDRLIFLRICEDRGIEPEFQLRDLTTTPGIYPRLVNLYIKADQKYNSGLFHFSAEKGQTTGEDTFTPNLVIDDKALKEIITSLYYPESAYAFNVIPVEILGQVYEQFLGKVIRLTAGGQAKVEEKPEVRKAGGVYYTPRYIVDYIVENTVGKLLEGKTPKEAAELRIVDPACGSGSFLLGAYQYLLDWHHEYYLDPVNGGADSFTRGRNPVLAQRSADEYHLTTAEKKRILVNNIYGVDLDHQAVEVTKLSLLLKLLEEETGQLSLGFERVLPDLGYNIRCGNSLIGWDYFQGQLMADDEEVRRVNPFDWKREFPKVYGQGGFDVVIGNPPYIQLSMADYYDPKINSYFISIFNSSMGRFNTFAMFIHTGINKLLRKDGFISFIVPNTILTQEGYRDIRNLMLEYSIISITSFTEQVFRAAVVETIIFVVKKESRKGGLVNIEEIGNNEGFTHSNHTIDQGHFSQTNNSVFLTKVDQKGIDLKSKLEKESVKLGAIANINQAIALKSDRSKSLFTEKMGENFKPVLDGRNINRYRLNWDKYYLAYDVNKIHSCKRIDIFEAKEKIFFRRVGDRIIATLDEEQYYALNTLVVITPKQTDSVDLKFVLGLLNSRLLNYYYVNYLKSSKKVFSEIQARQIAELPIKNIDFSSENKKEIYDAIRNKVDILLRLNREAPEISFDQERLQRTIAATDSAINRLVYDMYSLTEEEIKLIETIEQ